MANKVNKPVVKANTVKQTAETTSNTPAGSVDVKAATVDTQAANLAPAEQATVVTNAENTEAKQSTTLPPTTQPALVKALKVIAKVDKFRRGGIVFDRTETTLALAVLTDEQIKQIKDEPLLTATEVEIEVKAEVEAE